MLKKSIFISSSILLATCSCWADVSISGSSRYDYKSSTQDTTYDSEPDLKIVGKSGDSGAALSGFNYTTVITNDEDKIDSGLDNFGSLEIDSGFDNFGSLEIESGRIEYLNNTYTASNDGEVGTATRGGYSIKYSTPTISGVNLGVAYSSNSDDASAKAVSATYSYAMNAGALSLAIGYTDSNNGDTTLMPKGASFGLSYDMGPASVYAKTTEGQGFDRQTVAGATYKVGDGLAVGMGYSKGTGIGQYNRDTNTTSLSASYAIARGASAVLTRSYTDGYSDEDSSSIKENATSLAIVMKF